MAPASIYALHKPNALDTVGYAYGKVVSEVQGGRVTVARVHSGRWIEGGDFETQRGAAEMEFRVVTEAEATSGIGTYVGSSVCIARVPRGKPKVWDYGTVVGYTWKDEDQAGVLDVTVVGETYPIPFEKEELHELALETYALRPCAHRGVIDIMAAEMRSIHNAVRDHFNGIEQSARRSSAVICRKLNLAAVDENQIVPVYNLESTRVHYLPVDHLLNYIFYFQGKRRAPQGLEVPKSLFVERPACGGQASEQPMNSSGDEDGLKRLYDSDDDLDTPQDPPSRTNNAKREREVVPELASRGESRLMALRQRLEDDPGMVRDIDQLIALRQADLGKGNVSALVGAVSTDTKSQFKPTRQQATAHGLLVNGKYASLDSQMFVETMQSQSKEFDFLPHPGAARGFFGWDFGFRGLSCMHFAPMDLEEEREFQRSHDMTDSSSKNKLPRAPKAVVVADILAAMEVTSLLVGEMYQSIVTDLVDSARRFLLQLRKTKVMVGPEAVPELVAWIDDCFERFRSCLVREDLSAAAEIKHHFQFGHESYARVVQRVTSLKIEAHTSSSRSRSDTRPKSQQRKGKSALNKHNNPSSVPVPQAVVAALPIRRGKKLCMKFLSVEGCPGEGDTCIYDYRGHFMPNKLPTIVKSFIAKSYGGIRPTSAEEEGVSQA